MAAAYQPPSPDGKPFIPDWIPPAPTKTEQDWADLHTIELSRLDSDDPKVVDELIDLARIAIKEDGFLYLKDYGVSLDQVSQTAIWPISITYANLSMLADASILHRSIPSRQHL